MARRLSMSLAIATLLTTHGDAAVPSCGYRPSLLERALSRCFPQHEFEMRDGYAREGLLEVFPSAATWVHIREVGEGGILVDGDEYMFEVDLNIPDASVGALPFDVRFDDVPCKYWTRSRARGNQTAAGSLRFLRAVSIGFIVRYELACDGQSYARTAVLRAVGARRVGVWPYSPVQPGESWYEQAVQTVKDAWNGLW